MKNKSFTDRVIDTTASMLEANRNNISSDAIVKEVYRDIPVPRDVYRNACAAVQKHLSRYGNILRSKLNYDVVVIGEYYTIQRHYGLTDREQGQRCLPTRSEDNKPWGLHVRTGPDDQISNAAFDQTKHIERGIHKRIKDTEARGLSNGSMSTDIVNEQERKASQCFPIELSTTHILLPEVVDSTNVYLKWVPTPKQLQSGKKNVVSDAHTAGDEEEIA